MIQSHEVQSKFSKQMEKMKGLFKHPNDNDTTDHKKVSPKRKTQTPRIGQSRLSEDSGELSDDSLPSNVIGVKSRNFNDEYELGQKLGEGTHGFVRLCWKKENKNEKFAVKIIKTGDEELMTMVRQTFLNTTIVRSPFIVKYHKLFIDTNVMYIVMEYVPFKNLENLLQQQEKLKEQQVQKMIMCLLKAIRALHRAGICHRDIKPDNIQVNQEDFTVKLIDFGVSRRYVNYNSTTFRYNRQQMLTVTGNINYRAPEIYEGIGYGYDQQVDLWSVGVVAYQSLTGRLPIQQSNVGDIISILSQSEPYTEMFNHIDFLRLTPSCRDFLKRLLMWNPLKRLNSLCNHYELILQLEALKHIWIPFNATPSKPINMAIPKKKAKDDIDVSKISQNSDIINKSLINSAMMLNQELQNTIIRSKKIDTIQEEDTPKDLRVSLEFSIKLKESSNGLAYKDFKSKLRQFKLEASQKIHTHQYNENQEIKLLHTIKVIESNQIHKQSDTSIDMQFHLNNHGQGVDLFGLNFCESQASITGLEEIQQVEEEEHSHKQSIDPDLLQQIKQFDL